MMGTAETRRAIEAAKGRWGEWRRKPAKERRALLRKWHDIDVGQPQDLGKLMTAEQGKPLAEAKGEVAYAASIHTVVRRGSQNASTEHYSFALE